MSQATFTFRTVTSRKGDYEVADHSIERKESRKLSRFQALGYLLCWVDALAEDESNPGRSISAIFGFDGEVAALGFDRYDPVHILTAPNWKTRMLAAWCVIGADERAIAKQLDYGDLHNYWPTPISVARVLMRKPRNGLLALAPTTIPLSSTSVLMSAALTGPS